MESLKREDLSWKHRRAVVSALGLKSKRARTPEKSSVSEEEVRSWPTKPPMKLFIPLSFSRSVPFGKPYARSFHSFSLESYSFAGREGHNYRFRGTSLGRSPAHRVKPIGPRVKFLRALSHGRRDFFISSYPGPYSSTRQKNKNEKIKYKTKIYSSLFSLTSHSFPW